VRGLVDAELTTERRERRGGARFGREDTDA
jgi:hypothetical protein